MWPPAHAPRHDSPLNSRRRAPDARTDAAPAVHAFLALRRSEEERFLAELVKMPSDNPPGDCAPHAQRAAQLLEALGFTVESHVVPDAAVKANGMVVCTNLVVRVRFGSGDGPVMPLK